MTVVTPARKEELDRRGLLLEWFTVAWNVIEGVVAIGAGVVTGSVSLVAFGADSSIEVISAVALLWRLRKAGPHARAEERGAAEQCGYVVLFDAEMVGIRGSWAQGRDL